MRAWTRSAVLVALVVAAAMWVTGCGKEADHKDHGHDKTTTESDKTGGDKIAQKTCPVMEGNPINKNLYVDHDGRRVYFCCDMCVDTFKKDPEKYIKKLDEQLKGAAPADSDSKAEGSGSTTKPEGDGDK